MVAQGDGPLRSLIIGTRGSSLATCQAQIVQTKLEERYPQRTFTLQTIKARADQDPELPLVAFGGEGIFVKELEAALAEGRIDLAVHSMKDVPLAHPPSLSIAAVLDREEPRDALVSMRGAMLDQLLSGSRIGTSSLRRRSQLLRYRPNLTVLDIRGNVDTRLRKLDEGRYDAIIVAACGLIRLGLEARIAEYLDLSLMLPEPGQGALAVETRRDDAEVVGLVSALEDAGSRACVEAERAFLQALGGGCRVPIAAYASRDREELALQGVVAAPDGSADVRGTLRGPFTEPMSLGRRLAEQCRARGAEALLSMC
ncbi:MAG: hydroxymethylbilane synthase [Candidatus Omnitrophica bacterium]|nr:hydroxymethylbilane synthase [Candidatus Omnitrophota bacterium]